MRPYKTILQILLCSGVGIVSAQPRTDTTIDRGWKFLRGDVAGAQAVKYEDARWERISLPHTWNAWDGQDGKNDYYRGAGWYRKELKLDPRYQGKSLFLKFDGVSNAAQLFVNGTLAGSHKGGFGAFCLDVTSLVSFDRPNIIAARVTNARDTTIAPLRGDFTVFGGIYRSVHLLVLDKASISPLDHASSGVYVKQSHVDAERADLDVTTVLRNSYEVKKDLSLRCSIADGKGVVVKKAESAVTLSPGAQQEQALHLSLPSPHLWNGQKDSYLYQVTVELLENGKVKDRVTQPIGLRFFSVDPEKGFFLNGQHYPLHGVNRHQDRENMGWAIGIKEHRQDLALIEEIGATAVRLAHYQQAQEFYDLCDRDGMVVWAELGNVDEVNASPEFAAIARQQLTELIKQHYNHPSIIFWSIFNELMPESNRELYGKIVSELNALAKQLDPTRLTTMASRSMYGPDEYINTVTDLLGFNVYKGWYEETPEEFAVYADLLHHRFPMRAICISEYGAGAGTTQHEYPPAKPNPGGSWHPEEWQSRLHEVTWKAMAERPWLWGTFIWVMFDFASDGRSEGELPGRNDKGLVTSDRKIKKDAFYLYKANWNPELMVYVTSRRYTPRPAGVTEVRVYSNCDSVSLSLNGKMLGIQRGDHNVFVWSGVTLSARKNVVEAVGYRSGKRIKDTCSWVAK